MRINNKVIPVLLVLSLTIMACGINIQTPKIKTGPEVTTTVAEVYPDTKDAPRVVLNMGAGTLKINEGNDRLVEGKIRTNIGSWVPEIKHSDETVTISQGDKAENFSFPSSNIVNDWDLRLGTIRPVSLQIEAGAYTSDILFGKVPLTELNIKDGASKSTVTFSEPNSQVMESFEYDTGASQVNLIYLANANFKEMNFKSGAGSYTLDFSGELKHDARVSIKSGLSNMKIMIPSDTNVEITLDGGVNNVSLKGTWTVDSNRYKTQSSSGPKLEIEIDMGVGNLELISQNNNSL